MNEDAELLRGYFQDRSESDFTELIRRHVDLVYSAALRLAGGDVHRAEDVTQEVFAELARQANRLTTHPTLAGWLYTTTRRMTLRANRTEYRRKLREREANSMSELVEGSSTKPDWDHLRPVLEDAMHELTEPDRVAVLLRFFQNKALKEVGWALGLSENAARMRVDRALDKLRVHLAQRGVTSTAAALTAALAGHAISAAPPALVTSLTSASLANAAMGAGTSLTLLKLMTMTKLKTGLISALFVGGVTAPIVMQHNARSELRAKELLLQQQSEQLAQLMDENQRLSNTIVGAGSAFSDEHLRELLRLRNEVGMLRKVTNGMARLLEENNRLKSSLSKLAQNSGQSEKDPAAEQQQQAMLAKLTDAKTLMLGFIMYADANQDRFPTNQNQIARYLGQRYLGPNPAPTGTNDFELLYNGLYSDLRNLNSVIILRERQAWPTPDGKWAKTYGFADGHSEIHSEPFGNFDAWEAQRMAKP